MFKGNFSLRHQPVTSSFQKEEEQVSERQRKGLPWVLLTSSTLMGLRKSLLPAQGLCPPWGLRTGNTWVSLILAPPTSTRPSEELFSPFSFLLPATAVSHLAPLLAAKARA